MVRPGRANPYSAAAVHAASVTDTREDLAALADTSRSEPLSIDDITRNLTGRLANGFHYTKIGARCLVSLNSPPSARSAVSSTSDQSSKEYAEAFKGQENKSLPPHVFNLAADAYMHMLRNQEDQCIVLSGESGSGKSESHRLIARHLCDLSKTSTKKSKVHSAVLKVDSVLSAFGNAQTPFNKDASCCSRYSEYQFNSQGKMVGLKLIDYLLEKSRVSGAEDGGRSFHIFYYLLAGATHEEKMQFHLSDPAHFHYLSQSKLRISAVDSNLALDELRDNMKALGIGRRQQTQLWQILAAILHLGNVTFHDDPNNTQEACTVRNYAQLELVATLLGLHPASIEAVLTYRTKMVGRDLTSVFLDSEGAAQQRDNLARALYSVTFSWIVEQINNKLCQDESVWSSFVAVLDTPGFAGRDISGHGFHRLLVNFQNEKLRNFINEQLFDLPREAFKVEGLEPPTNNYLSNREILALLTSPKSGILPLVDREAARGSRDSKITEKIYAANAGAAESDPFIPSQKPKYAFGIRHYAGIVEYDTHGFADSDADVLQSDFVTLVRGSPEQPGTANLFLRSMFSDRLVATQTSKRDGKTVIAASSKSRNPSMKRRKSKKDDDEEQHVDPTDTVGHQFRNAFAELLATLNDTQSWFIFHVKVSDGNSSRSVDQETIRRQVAYYDLSTLSSNPAVVYTAALPHGEFLKRYAAVLPSSSGDARRQCESLILSNGWTRSDAVLGKGRLFLSEPTWSALERQLKTIEESQPVERTSKDSRDSYMVPSYAASETDFEEGSNFDDSASHYESEFEYEREPRASVSHSTLKGDLELGSVSEKSATPLSRAVTAKEVPAEKEPVKKKKMTGTRCRWLACTWFSTWYIPPFCLSICGMRPRDRQIAWREKVTLCFIILLMNAIILFFIIGLGFVLCPKKNELSPGEITTRNNLDSKATVHMYGSYYVVPGIWTTHNQNGWQSDNDGFWKSQVLGRDVSQLFPKTDARDDFFTTYCPGYTKPNTFEQFPKDIKNPLFDTGSWFPHQHSTFLNKVNQYRKGVVVWDKASVAERVDKQRMRYIVAYDRVFDVSAMYLGNYYETVKIAGGVNFMGDYISQLMDRYSAPSNVFADATPAFEVLKRNNTQQWTQAMTCMQGLFYVGNVDHRNDVQCEVPNYIMVVASCIVVSVIGFKFLAALQFGGKKQPEEHDKFVICQVPCYTEGEVSLLRTLESLAMLDYDDKHKLLFVICDGMIIGSGNDRPTPRIVLDILGVDPSVDPEALAFQSLGEGNKQLNMGKVYSGLYEIQGRVVPYIVVVKVGKPSERQRPGNRGKRDSQLILMRFLSRVHFNQPMNPLELELYHQMKNVIGVDPSFYEYTFMVDADTEVYPDSLNRLVSNMARDSKVAGICGETQISNEKDSWVSMIQVYEYFISHHMAKAFESLFGSVTCLPGCFCMYRIRTPVKNVPLLVAPGVIKDYSENEVDTLHLKNLLHLGEDRYLTTLMLKHFPNMKTTFTADAKCKTNAPDKWSVLLSQRRRWINSTVHNLLELLWLPEMCGFCCFSMRFVVFLDLFATFVQPAALVYIGYLIWALVTETQTQFPLISIIMIAAIYGFQMIIFLLKREWQHIGWMIIYMLAMPIFGAYIPLYSFWHFDDFSWGNTRRVVEEGGKKVEKVLVEEPFDPASIPVRKWSDFEAERLERDELQSHSSYHSGSGSGSGRSRGKAGTAYGGSVYGGASAYGGTGSVYAASAYGGSQYGGMPVPPYPVAPSVAGGPEYGGYNPRMSWGTQYTGVPDFSAAAPPPSSGAAPVRRTSMRSQYTATTADAPRALPSDDEILRQVRRILSTADLMSVTKKSVREDLSAYFGCDLGAKKEWIHRCIDGVLKGEL
ncbi:uncharacterized protein SPPG_06138 [Spizellomyces punctatus DAOM BR117]|uniref:chitin synthase n=1 Tax=Spizellomyces punctatus (strain DAOM BR117) TaxID=645134 RepID=A0A0L0HC23_SPIPD|nr:uncharacterized protein SPPG_06138 [Spizellomyces punctatus DAOM BR117]KNC98434.1 hypothetical protein SPPG_06138 [Spizellomyces punctatus DAOM BR117]|eukprot:XP_016606474.1 hypothetical protein SPPG_06138 [Spizellomyces punctatus DAOM BR117]